MENIHRRICNPPEGIPSLAYWRVLCGQMIPRGMLALACATGRASHARQVKGDDPDIPLIAEDDVERVRACFLHSPKKSMGTAAKELSMSKTRVWGILHKRFLVINVCNHGELYETPCINAI
jgi:hypothetical protein